jgi:hypothetical protein
VLPSLPAQVRWPAVSCCFVHLHEAGCQTWGCQNAVTDVRTGRHPRLSATWLVDDGVPPNMVQRVTGHERASTTLDLYTRRTADTSRILAALDDDEEADR